MPHQLLDRFKNDDAGSRRLLDLLLRQGLVGNDTAVAESLAKAQELLAYDVGDTIVEQDGSDTDIYFVLIGEVAVEVNGREVARRSAGQHVGEMTLIDPRHRRSATVRAVAQTVVARVSEPTFSDLAGLHPVMWRRLALELGNRLRERALHVRPRRDPPCVFIGSCSSPAALDLARAIQTAFAHDPWVTIIWTDGVFQAGSTPIESLVASLDSTDFALLVVTPDDLTTSASIERPSPRDNVVFELGLMMGALGRDRTFMVRTRTKPDPLRLPTDLLGVKALEVASGPPEHLAARVGPAASEFRTVVHRLGSR